MTYQKKNKVKRVMSIWLNQNNQNDRENEVIRIMTKIKANFIYNIILGIIIPWVKGC